MKRRNLLSFSVFYLLIIIILMDYALLLPNQVLIMGDLDIDFFIIGLIFGAYIIVSGISVIFLGYLTDIIDRKKVLIIAGCVWSLTAILHVFVYEIWLFVILRMIAAVAKGACTPIAISYLADIVTSEKRSKSFALWALLETLGGLIAGMLALAFNQIPYELIDVSSRTITENVTFIKTNYPDLLNTWRMPFILCGITTLVLTAINQFTAIEPKRAVKETYMDGILVDEAIQYSYKIKKSDLKHIFTRKTNIFLALNFFDVVATGILTAYIFPYIELELGISFGDPTGLLALMVLLLSLIPIGFIIGQFGLAHLGDKKVKEGDPTGRVKIATMCGILNIPFFLFALSMTPNVPNKSFFFGTVIAGDIGFWFLWIIFALTLGVALGFSLGIAPNWYSSMVDANLPEHRGTMVAMASFIDTIGRGIGAAGGGFMIMITDSFSATLFWATLIFGILSTLMWIPLFFYSKSDYAEIERIMKERAEALKKN